LAADVPLILAGILNGHTRASACLNREFKQPEPMRFGHCNTYQFGDFGMSEQWKVGDEVQLKSGGPIMTVIKVGTYEGEPGVVCTWFGKDNKPERHLFPPAALLRYAGG
jgi:uncharacterized protein YodC (DUF2158 family)